MKIIRNPLRLNLGFMLQQPVGASRVLPYDYGPVLLGDDLSLEKLAGKSEVTRTPQGLVIKTTLSTVVEYECGRCLTGISLPISSEFTELFVYSRKDRSADDLVLPEDGYVDLGPIARENLLLEIPINAVCRPDCKGLCKTCGQNLNEAECGHKVDPIDPRMAKLRSLLNDS